MGICRRKKNHAFPKLVRPVSISYVKSRVSKSSRRKPTCCNMVEMKWPLHTQLQETCSLYHIVLHLPSPMLVNAKCTCKPCNFLWYCWSHLRLVTSHITNISTTLLITASCPLCLPRTLHSTLIRLMEACNPRCKLTSCCLDQCHWNCYVILLLICLEGLPSYLSNQPNQPALTDACSANKSLDGCTGLHPSLKGILNNLSLPWPVTCISVVAAYGRDEIRVPSFFTYVSKVFGASTRSNCSSNLSS